MSRGLPQGNTMSDSTTVALAKAFTYAFAFSAPSADGEPGSAGLCLERICVMQRLRRLFVPCIMAVVLLSVLLSAIDEIIYSALLDPIPPRDSLMAKTCIVGLLIVYLVNRSMRLASHYQRMGWRSFGLWHAMRHLFRYGISGFHRNVLIAYCEQKQIDTASLSFADLDVVESVSEVIGSGQFYSPDLCSEKSLEFPITSFPVATFPSAPLKGDTQILRWLRLVMLAFALASLLVMLLLVLYGFRIVDLIQIVLLMIHVAYMSLFVFGATYVGIILYAWRRLNQQRTGGQYSYQEAVFLVRRLGLSLLSAPLLSEDELMTRFGWHGDLEHFARIHEEYWGL
jgi:hypothetical protein